MKKALLSLTLLPIFIHADGEFIAETKTSKKVVITEKQTETPSFIEYHNRMAVFGSLHQVYERIETDAFYAGVETWLIPVGGSKGASALCEAELRMGYNYFYNGRDHVTPFAGVGIVKDLREHRYQSWWEDSWNWGRHRVKKRHAQLPAVAYGVIGALYDHEFNTVVNLGVNLKGMIGGGVNKKHFNWGNPVYGFDVSVPLTFRFGHRRHWDFRIEPFDIYLNGKNVHVNFFGLRNTIGYRF